ncbi:hypothetical protein [Desulfosporosinus sp. OT]|nr:hypothetical protein [Desulfosporosinus sp. OT]EGW36408.1 hypothetical protein DOT_5716 [Desulfosporosinus sp. OT]
MIHIAFGDSSTIPKGIVEESNVDQEDFQQAVELYMRWKKFNYSTAEINA